MLQPTNKHLENLMFLRDVVFPRLLELPVVSSDKHVGDGVDLNDYISEDACGVVACALGHYAIMRYGYDESVDRIEDFFGGPVDHEHLAERDFGREACDIGLFDAKRLRFESVKDDLLDRAKVLDELIAERVSVTLDT